MIWRLPAGGTAILLLAWFLAVLPAAALADKAGAPQPPPGEETRPEAADTCQVLLPEGPQAAFALAAVPPGPRQVIAIIVNFLDRTVSSTLFGGADPVTKVGGVLFDDVKNVADMVADASWGQVTFLRDPDLDGQPDIAQVTIQRNLLSEGGCLTTTWANDADALAQAAGWDLGPYQHRMYVIPTGAPGCSWSGLAFVGCGGSYCRSWMKTATATTYAHELGHNLGMHHASTDPNNDGVIDVEYGDNSDVMGLSSIWRTFNGPHKALMNWLPPAQVVPVRGGNQTVVIDALEINPAAALNPQVLRIDRPAAPLDPYYLSYRAALGYDVTLSSLYRNRLSVHHARSVGVQTKYIVGLPDGSSFSDAAAHNITVRLLSHDSTTATVEILRTEPDADMDGYGDGSDCNDADPGINPGVVEVCDYIDNNCDGQVDEGFVACDIDMDGYDTLTDCNDNNPLTYPGATEICDHEDNNCDTVVDEGLGPCDIDMDGYDELVDCNDLDADVHPHALELCDFTDNDCNGVVDDPDSDGDLLGDCQDACPDDPLKAYPSAIGGWCDCGVPETTDQDQDGIPDCADNCPTDPNNLGPDTDMDGVNDCYDQCPLDPLKAFPLFEKRCPCGIADTDSDGDTVLDCFDRCPGVDDRVDTDLDGIPDCLDCAPTDPTIRPNAVERNDGYDNHCPGEPGYGLVDELTGRTGLLDPANADRYGWPYQPLSDSYEVVRTGMPFATPGTYVITSDTFWTDSQVPAVGAAFLYLVRPLSPHSGSWGAGSDLVERTIP